MLQYAYPYRSCGDAAVTLYEANTTEGQYGLIATGISLDDYMVHYAANFCEYVEGAVIRMSPVHEGHDRLAYYLRLLLDAYFELRPHGQLRSAPFVLRLPAFPERRREPDIQVILDANPGTLNKTCMDGPADICIEIISPESIARDRGEKYVEYERGGVREYWLFDPERREADFYRLNTDGQYIRQHIAPDAAYTTPLLPGLQIALPALWDDPLPGPAATAAHVATMLASSSME